MATFRYTPGDTNIIRVHRDDAIVYFGHRSHCIDWIYANGEEDDILIYPAYTTTVGEDRRQTLARRRRIGIESDKKMFARSVRSLTPR